MIERLKKRHGHFADVIVAEDVYKRQCEHTTEKKDEAAHVYGTAGVERYTCKMCIRDRNRVMP